MQKMLRGCAIALLSCAGLLAPAHAFATYKLLGGAVHRDIVRQALHPLGVGAGSIKIIVRGTNSQDNPLGVNWTISEHHFTENKLKSSYKYVRSQLNRALVQAAGADHDRRACRRCLFQVGEALHPLQDFYSHSNYLELLLRDKQTLQPPDWDNLPAEVRTCYYWYGSRFDQEPFHVRTENICRLKKKFPGVRFHLAAEYEARNHTNDEQAALAYAVEDKDLLHLELNKDTGGQLEGKVVSAAHGKTYFELARELAVADTARHWQMFEEQIKERYGPKAAQIIQALKGAHSHRRGPG